MLHPTATLTLLGDVELSSSMLSCDLLYLDFSLDTFIAGVSMETRKGSAPSTECDARHCRAREEHTSS